MKKLQNSLLKSIVLFVLVIAHLQPAFAQKRPNILLIMTDDQGIGDVHIKGNDIIKTPNMDAIAKQGAEFKQFIVNFNCSPTRASIITGRDNYRTGVVGVTETSPLMKSSEVTLAKVLSDAGYRTGLFGKWHLGDSYPMRPSDKGFQETLIHKGGGIGQASDPPGNSYFNPILEENNVKKVFQGYCDDIFADATIKFIEKSKDKPFFAFYATNLPHFPLTVSDKWADPFRKMGLHELNARTYGMIANVDANIGRLLSKLKELGIEDNTIVVFMSDNGPRTKRTKNDVYPDRYNMNLRGTKTSVYDNGIRAPFFIKWPGKIAQGVQYNNLAAHIDVMPTLLEACNVKVPENLKLDGISLMPLLNGKVNVLPEREIFIQGHAGSEPFKYFHFTVRGQRYKLIAPNDDPYGNITRPDAAEIKKIIASLELYDIETDSSEITNIAKQHPDIVKKMLANYEKWFDQVIKDRGTDWPQRIFIGTRFQTNVQLSRFDWGGPQTQGEQSDRYGYWEVFSAPGKYRITLRFKESAKSGTASLKYLGLEKSMPVSKGNSKVVFEDVKLPEGPGRFEAFLKIDAQQIGVQYVDVEIETDSGIIGIGEGGSKDMIEQCAQMIIGEDPFRIEHIWQLLYRGMFYPPGREKLHAVGALEMALWDIKGKALNVPVYDLLGGATRDFVECYATGFRPSTAKTQEGKATDCLKAGFRSFRIGPTGGNGEETFDFYQNAAKTIEFCKSIDHAVGGEGNWAIDLHTRFDTPEAIKICNALENLSPYFVEDAIRSENPGAYRSFRQLTKVPLAVGEQFGDRWDVNEMIEQQLINYSRLTLPNTGGIVELKKIAALCETHYVGMIPHFTGPLSTAALVHVLGSSSPSRVMMELAGGGIEKPAYFNEDYIHFNNGKLYLNPAPGLGVKFDPKKAEFIMEIVENTKNQHPILRSPDGAIHNW